MEELTRRPHIISLEADDEPWWIILFAPSAAGHVMPALLKHFSMTVGKSSPSSGRGSGLRRARLAAIGPTTAKFVREDLRLDVDGVADAPTAESLVSSLVACEYLDTQPSVQGLHLPTMPPPLSSNYQRPEMSSSSTSLLLKPGLKSAPSSRGSSPVSFFIPPSPRHAVLTCNIIS